MSEQSYSPKAPQLKELPAARLCAARGGPELRELRVRLEVVTPIFGGGHESRMIDDVDVIRAASVRGHLRFWWRALHAAQYARAEELYERESALWGRAATDNGGRSAVEIRVHLERRSDPDDTKIQLKQSRGQQTAGAYALWPARNPHADRRKPGTQFLLTLKVTAIAEAEVRNAVRAWISFGGYGGRTRRGLGSLKVVGETSTWVPAAATRDALMRLLGVDIFAAPMKMPVDVPWLGGAAIHVGRAGPNAETAWTTALAWLEEFRQGTNGTTGDRAREPGARKQQPQRPSISNWPEADKIRRIKNKTKDHKPWHNATAAWPRAGFGLPISGRFQKVARNNDKEYDEPGPFELCWRAGKIEHDRLASPLIVKALPLADGTFAPCALWLNRAHPPSGEVVLRGTKNSQAPFDRLVANGDTARFSALANKTSLREAFLDWLHAKYQTTVVAP